jgi:hypothetical protein
MGMGDLAKSYVSRWLDKHPGDEEVRAAFENIDSLIGASRNAAPVAGGSKPAK